VITRTQYEAGKIIIQENESGETAYVIEEGKVAVTKALGGQVSTWLTLGRERSLAK